MSGFCSHSRRYTSIYRTYTSIYRTNTIIYRIASAPNVKGSVFLRRFWFGDRVLKGRFEPWPFRTTEMRLKSLFRSQTCIFVTKTSNFRRLSILLFLFEGSRILKDWNPAHSQTTKRFFFISVMPTENVRRGFKGIVTGDFSHLFSYNTVY